MHLFRKWRILLETVDKVIAKHWCKALKHLMNKYYPTSTKFSSNIQVFVFKCLTFCSKCYILKYVYLKETSSHNCTEQSIAIITFTFKHTFTFLTLYPSQFAIQAMQQLSLLQSFDSGIAYQLCCQYQNLQNTWSISSKESCQLSNERSLFKRISHKMKLMMWVSPKNKSKLMM